MILASFPRSLRAAMVALGTAVMCLAPLPLAAQIAFVFDNNSGEEDVYITFNNSTGQPAFGVSYFSLSQNATVNLTRNGNGFSSSVALSDVQNATFNVTSLQSGGFYVSYGAGLPGSAPSALSPGDGLFNTRWFQVETTIFSPGNAANNGDFTAVNLYSGSILIENYNGSTLSGTVGFGSTSSATIFQNLYAALTASGELGTDTTINGLTQQSVIIKPAAGDQSAQFVRVLSPSNWGTAGSSTNSYWVGPYHSFAPYAQHLQTSNNGGAQVTNISYTFQTNSTEFNGNNSYAGGLRYVCTFTATPTNRTVNSVSGPTFTFSGSIAVSSLPYPGNGNTITPLGTVTGLTIDLPIDAPNSTELSYLIYAQPNSFTANTQFNAAWASSGITANDLALAQQFVIGDLTEGLLTGFVGSEVVFTAANSTNGAYFGQMAKDIPSNVWWSAYTGSMYRTLQPDSPATSPYYSVYSSVIFPAGNTYSAPFDDRFQATHNPDIAVNTEWLIRLNPTGNLDPNATPTPTPGPVEPPTLRLKRKSVSSNGRTARAVIEFEATAGSAALRQLQYKYTTRNSWRKSSLPAGGRKNISITNLPLGRRITFDGQAIDASGRKSKVAKISFNTPRR